MPYENISIKLRGLMGISFGVLILQGLEVGTAASGTEAHFQIPPGQAVVGQHSLQSGDLGRNIHGSGKSKRAVWKA